MKRKRSTAAPIDETQQADIPISKIKTVRQAKNGVEVMFRITDFQAITRNLDLCFCELTTYSKEVDETIQYVYDRYDSEDWPDMLLPANTADQEAKDRLVPIVCTYHILLALLDYSEKLKETLNGDRLFTKKTSTNRMYQKQKSEQIDGIKDFIGFSNFPYMLLAIDDWLRMIVTENHFNQAKKHLTQALNARPATIAQPKNKHVKRALFIFNTLYTLRLFADACWKALVPAGKGKPEKNA